MKSVPYNGYILLNIEHMFIYIVTMAI